MMASLSLICQSMTTTIIIDQSWLQSENSLVQNSDLDLDWDRICCIIDTQGVFSCPGNSIPTLADWATQWLPLWNLKIRRSRTCFSFQNTPLFPFHAWLGEPIYCKMVQRVPRSEDPSHFLFCCWKIGSLAKNLCDLLVISKGLITSDALTNAFWK